MIKFISRLDLHGSRIDREAGIIKGVSLIALGEARGHGKAVDQKTLETVRDCAKQYDGGLRVKFNPTTFTHGAGSLAGRIPSESITIDGGKTVGDLHLYKALPTEIKEYLFEIAEETPGNIGLSIEFSGDDETIDNNKFARCSEIYAATIVDLPAANPTGLFAVGKEEDLTKVKNENKTKTNEELSMDEETIKKLSTAIAEQTVLALKPVLSQRFQGDAPPKDEDKEKEEMAAAGVADGDDEETKKSKIAAYRESQKPVSAMTAGELSDAVTRSNMQFFRQTGNRPAKISAEPDRNEGDPFEKRVRQHMEAGAKSRGLAINRARRDAPQEYNEWMAKKHPNVQQMVKK
jgi:hypothetical protein